MKGALEIAMGPWKSPIVRLPLKAMSMAPIASASGISFSLPSEEAGNTSTECRPSVRSATCSAAHNAHSW